VATTADDQIQRQAHHELPPCSRPPRTLLRRNHHHRHLLPPSPTVVVKESPALAMPSLSSVWNLEPPTSSSAASPLSPYDIEKHPSSSSTSSYPSHRSSMSWGSGSPLHLGGLRSRGVVKRVGLVIGLLCLGLWAVSSVGSGGGAGGALLKGWGKGSRGKVGQL
jgi:hypothetical protein